MSIQIVYTKAGRLEWDESKNFQNQQKHGYEFTICQHFFSKTNQVRIDNKRDYGETRYIATGEVGATILIAVYTFRNGGRRIISVRRANRNERKAYFKRKTKENS